MSFLRRVALGAGALAISFGACAAGGAPKDLVLVRAGTLPIVLTAPHGGRLGIPDEAQRTAPDAAHADPSDRMLVAANLATRRVREGDGTRQQPATLTTYRVGDEGKLTFVTAYPVATDGKLQFWSGMVTVS